MNDPTIVYSPYKLGEDELQEIFRKFSFVKPENTQFIVDESLLVGVIINHQNKIIDLSLKGKITNLKKKLYEID